MTIGKRLYVNFGIILTMVLVLFLVNLVAVQREHAAKAAAAASLQLNDATDATRFQMMQNRLYLSNYLLSGDTREVDRMMKEAESHAEDDKKRREEIELRNRADQAVYGAERLLKDTGDKIGASDKAAIESAMDAVKKANETNDPAAIQRALDQLTAAQHKAAEALYKQQAPGGPAPGGETPGGQESSKAEQKTGDVIDAEVVDEGKQ